MEEKISLIVPCYNEEEMVVIFYQTIIPYMEKLMSHYEIIFINDGSKDNTLLELTKLSEKDAHLKVINFSRNFGKEAAMLAGLEASTGDYVALIDVDLQHPPYLLEKMLHLIKEEGYDSVGAYRLGRNKKGNKSESWIRVLYSRLFYRFINWMSDVKMKENATDFRMMKRKVVNSLLKLKEYNRFSKGLFEWVGFKTTYVGYENIDRQAGRSSWSFFKLLNYALEGITSFSTVPLKLSGLLGIFSAFIAFVYMVYIIVDRIVSGAAPSGWATIVSLILFLGGIMLISLGLLGEYIGRIYGEVKKRPVYIIDEVIEHKEENKDDQTD